MVSKYDLRLFLKVFKEVLQRMLNGRELQSFGAATEKALSPEAVEVLGIARRRLSADRRLRHDDYGVKSSRDLNWSRDVKK